MAGGWRNQSPQQESKHGGLEPGSPRGCMYVTCMQRPRGDSQKQHLADGSAVLGRDHHIHHFFQVEAPGQAHSRPLQQVYGKDHGDWGCLDLELVRVGP